MHITEKGMARTDPGLCRRAFLLAATLGVAARPRPADAGESNPPDIGIYCDSPLAHAMREAGTRFADAAGGAPVAVLVAPAAVILGQLHENPGEDILVLPHAQMDQAALGGWVDSASRSDLWRNRLVLAARAGTLQAGHNDMKLSQLLQTGVVAATDPTPASALDGMAVLDALGLTQTLAGRIAGVANEGDAAYMVKTGAARFGLMYMTDVRADPDLEVASVLDPALAPPGIFAAALNSRKTSVNCPAFLRYLASKQGQAVLHEAGLEAMA
jgi:molybdate transport system substrate-binding protein